MLILLDEIVLIFKLYVEFINVLNDLFIFELLCKNSFFSDGLNMGDLFYDVDFYWIKYWYWCLEDCFVNYFGFE